MVAAAAARLFVWGVISAATDLIRSAGETTFHGDRGISEAFMEIAPGCSEAARTPQAFPQPRDDAVASDAMDGLHLFPLFALDAELFTDFQRKLVGLSACWLKNLRLFKSLSVIFDDIVRNSLVCIHSCLVDILTTWCRKI